MANEAVKKEKLFDKFPPVSTAEWMKKIHSDLKGMDFNKKLVWKTNEGFDLMPFYRREDMDNIQCLSSIPGEFPFVRGTKISNNNWRIRQDIEVGDYAEANRKALSVLMKGIDSLGFIISDPETVSKHNFNILLRDINPGAIAINFLCNGKAKEILNIISGILIEKGVNFNELTGAIEADPLGRLMLNGKLCLPPAEGFNYLASLTQAAMVFPNLRTVDIKASDFNNAGGDIVQELAFGISMGNEYLAQFTERGLNAENAASKIRFSFGIGSNYFFEIAKLRAARLLWSVVQKGYIPENGSINGMDIHCVTSRWNKTVYDPYVNMLRTQTESMSAVIGGADSLTVEPFDIVYKTPGEFSERIARNQQLILKEEAHFDKVADPAAGSYYIEKITSQIAGSAWELFIEIEEQGGFLSALKSGFIQKKISESSARRKKEVATRKTILLGTNQYPRAGEHISEAVDHENLFSRKINGKDSIVDPINLTRGAEDYEKLRLSVELSDKKPVVFLLPLGNPSMRSARAQFSSGFFECAGYRVINNKGFISAAEGVKSAHESKADIVVICSSDDEYVLFAPEIIKGMKGNAIIVIAGNPATSEELKAIGIDCFIHMRSDVPETISYFNNRFCIRNHFEQKRDYETRFQI